jgi:DNA-binding transcriptional LysR family regulator
MKLFLREKLTQEKTGQYHLKLGATLTIGEFILPNKLGTFLNQHPDMQITMLVNNTEQLLHQLDAGVLDFVLIEGYFPKNEYSFVPYARKNFVCVAGQNYSFSKQPEILEDLLQEPLIIRETGSGTRDIFEKNLERQNLLLNDFSKLIEIGNIATIKKLVAHNLGVTALYEIAVKEELANGSLIKIPIADLQHSHDFYFVWRKNSVFSDFYKNLASSL